jgi:mono/diheme cytochrome c family protein
MIGHGSSRARGLRRILAAVAALLILGLLALAAAGVWPRPQLIAGQRADLAPSAAKLARGAYLARAGDCAACHTARGGASDAGGPAIDTPFGRLFAPNITPERTTGIGNWSADDFWNALHNGRAPGGRLLYPAFPYPNYTRITRPDADALYTYLRSVPPVQAARRANALRFPYNQQATLALWRLLWFRPGVFTPAPEHDAQWNRGAYLVEGPGHCAACHSARNGFGASAPGLGGGLIPMLGWYAPSLTSDREAGLGDWEQRDVVDLLHTGVSRRATVFGPMAQVVTQSLQHLNEDDVRAMAVYLQSLPAGAQPAAEPVADPRVADLLMLGKKVYQDRCVDCHGATGAGHPPAYPPLAGNRALTMDDAVNPIRVVLNGGFAPGTAGNPRPYGMPAFGPVLGDEEVAAVVSYLRASWGNHANPVGTAQVNRYRGVPVDD